MKLLILIRGVPGSGKSTLARVLTTVYGGVHYEADMYFTDAATDEYRFDQTKLMDAHAWCQDAVHSAMAGGHSPVVVSNTFTRKWEMEAYTKLADLYGYQVQIITCQGSFGSIHGVPPEKVDQMRERFEW